MWFSLQVQCIIIWYNLSLVVLCTPCCEPTRTISGLLNQFIWKKWSIPHYLMSSAYMNLGDELHWSLNSDSPFGLWRITNRKISGIMIYVWEATIILVVTGHSVKPSSSDFSSHQSGPSACSPHPHLHWSPLQSLLFPYWECSLPLHPNHSRIPLSSNWRLLMVFTTFNISLSVSSFKLMILSNTLCTSRKLLIQHYCYSITFPIHSTVQKSWAILHFFIFCWSKKYLQFLKCWAKVLQAF